MSSGSKAWWRKAAASSPGAARVSPPALLKEAEDLWRGSAYSEVRDEPFARAEARRLEELLLSAAEARIDAGLTMGHHQALASELESLTGAYPLRERLWSQRMLALYRAGRQAEALRVFQDLRALLVAELGIEPGHDIAWLEHAILTQEPALDFPVPPEARLRLAGRRAGWRRPLPARAPRCPVGTTESPFVGRERESALLRDWWASVPDGGGRLLLVDGDPGIGKTRLVVELAATVEADRGIWSVGAVRRGPRRTLPALCRGSRPVLPAALGRLDLTHAGLAARRAVPARAPPG